MKRMTVRELHLKTSAIVRAVAEGESYIVEELGVPVAELRPSERPRGAKKLPNREAIISRMKRAGDSGRILEEDRS
jgi:antitoxin (DNA-binding transcriptional repressor) of toxin-antitoxin stability system